jgi:hypothetical protein
MTQQMPGPRANNFTYGTFLTEVLTFLISALWSTSSLIT